MKPIKIERIIKVIDRELEKNGKPYLVLSAANQLLLDEGLMTVSDRANRTLKILLEQGAISHAYQTQNSPKQWRIPHSNEIKREHYSSVMKVKTVNCGHCGTLSQHGSHCKGCGQYIVINGGQDDTQIRTDKPFKKQTQLRPDNKNFNKESNRFSLSAAAVIVFSFIIVGVIYSNSKESSANYESSPFGNNTRYYIIRDTYAATSKEAFTDMFSYINRNDQRALAALISRQEIILLKRDTEIDIVKVRLGYCVIREIGSTRHLWLEQEAFSKE